MIARQKLRSLGTQTHRVVDIHLPASAAVAMLVHEDYGIEIKCTKLTVSIYTYVEINIQVPHPGSSLHALEYDHKSIFTINYFAINISL